MVNKVNGKLKYMWQSLWNYVIRGKLFLHGEEKDTMFYYYYFTNFFRILRKWLENDCRKNDYRVGEKQYPIKWVEYDCSRPVNFSHQNDRSQSHVTHS